MSGAVVRWLLAAVIAAAAGDARGPVQADDVGPPSRGRALSPPWRFFASPSGPSPQKPGSAPRASASPEHGGGAIGRPDAGQDVREPIQLPPPRRKQPLDAKRPDLSASASSLGSVIGALAVVLGAFFLLVWLTRRGQAKTAMVVPAEVLELLGRAPLGGRQYMQLVRFGGKLLLLSVTPTGAETLSEISDPDEVNRLAGVCQQHRPGSITKSFRQMLHQLSGEAAADGFAATVGRSQLESAGGSPASRRQRLASEP